MTSKSTHKARSACAMVALCALALNGCGGGGGGGGGVRPPVVEAMQETLRLPAGHGLTAGELTVQPGASVEHGNVVVSCPAGGAACVVTVEADGTASYDGTGGMPTVMAALAAWNLPSGHGLEAGAFTVQPGASVERGNVVVSCPAGGAACVVTVEADGMAAYERTGGIPMFVLVPPEELPELPLQQPIHGAQAPIVDLAGILHVGANVAPPAGELTAGGAYNGVAVSSGRVRDGVGAERVLEFLEMHVAPSTSSGGPGSDYTFTRATAGLATYPDRPTVRLAEDTSEEYAAYAVRAVELINAALPYEKRMVFDTNPAPPLAAIDDIPDGQIFIDFAPTEEDWNLANRDYRPGAAGIFESQQLVEFNQATQRVEAKRMRAGHVWFDTERLMNAAWVPNPNTGEFEETVLDAPVVETDTVERVYTEDTIFSIMVHELLHGLGLPAHNDGVRFPDSVMRDSHLLIIKHLPGIDGEALLAAYSRFEPGTLPEELTADNLGPWEDTSFHLRGDLAFTGGEAAFGVAARNGLVQPWAAGSTPWTNLADNPVLSETVTWNGALLGMTRAMETVAGGARLAVDLPVLTGQLDFTNLEQWGVNAAPGSMGTGAIWGDGELGYDIEVSGNTFVQTGGDDGEVTGAFFGPAHEAMGGVVERTDLSAGFGGTR